MTDKTSYPVLSAVRHDGVLYAPSDPDHDTIELTPKEAGVLQKLKVIGEPVDVEPIVEDPPKEPSPPVLTNKERKARITEIIQALNPEKDFTQNGNPKVKAVEAVSGFDVTSDEIAAIWQTIKPADPS